MDKMKIYKVGIEDGCGVQNEYGKIFTTAGFVDFGCNSGKISSNYPQDQKWAWNKNFTWPVTLPLKPLHLV